MKAMIIVQEEQFSTDTLRQLQASVQAAYKKSFPKEKLTVFWNVMPKGHAITDRQLSQSSLVNAQVPNGTSKQVREEFLNECFNAWRDITKQHPDHVMISAIDTDAFKSMLKSNLERLSPGGKARFIGKMLFCLMQSKYQHGLLMSRFA